MIVFVVQSGILPKTKIIQKQKILALICEQFSNWNLKNSAAAVYLFAKIPSSKFDCFDCLVSGHGWGILCNLGIFIITC